MTRAMFAVWINRNVAWAASWSADILHPFMDRLNEPVNRDAVERFIRESRERLDYIEQELNREPTI